MGCLLAPFIFLKWCFTNGIKGIVVFFIVALVILIGFFVIRNAVTKAAPVAPPKPTATVNATIPTIKQAPFIVTTGSRYYYAEKAVKAKDGKVTVTNYWELINGKWVNELGSILLDAKFGEINIKRR